MRRRILLLTVVVLALIAAYWATRDGSRNDGPAAFARASVEIPREDTVELFAPTTPDSVESRASALALQPAGVARPTSASPWTGVRVEVTSRETGRPLTGAQVRAHITRDTQAWTDAKDARTGAGEAVRTDRDGLAELELVAGTRYTIDAHLHDGFGGTSIALDPPLAANEVRTIAIVLATTPDRVVHGRVSDRETGAPIAGAQVGRTTRWREIRPEDEHRTDADGRFRLVEWSRIAGTLSVNAAGYEHAWSLLTTGHETPETALEITLSRVATLRLNVLDVHGAPIAGARATLSTSKLHFGQPAGLATAGEGWPSDEHTTATTDEHGVAMFVDLPPRMPLAGVARAHMKEIYRPPEPITLAPGEARELEWRVGTGCTIRGIAREMDSSAAVDVPIWLHSARRYPHPVYFGGSGRSGRRRVETGVDGRFEFLDVAPGAWWLGPAPEREGGTSEVGPDEVAPHARVITIAPGDSAIDVEIRIQRGLSIAGRVLDAKGSPTSTAFVQFTRVSDGFSGQTTREQGESGFVIGPIEDGEYELRAFSLSDGSSDAVRARPGDTDVVLKLRPAARIRGLVVDAASGTPVDAEVRVRARPPADWSTSTPNIGSDGEFHFGALGAGIHDVVASTPSGLFGFVGGVEVAEGVTHDVRVVLARGARVRVRCAGPWPVCTVTVLAGDAHVVVERVERGTQGTFAVPAGALVVRVRDAAGGAEFDLAVTTQAGELRDVVFDGVWK